MKYLVAYDVFDNKRRRKIQKFLYQFSETYQKSALEIEMNINKLKYISATLSHFSEEEDLIALFYCENEIKLGKIQEVEFLI